MINSYNWLFATLYLKGEFYSIKTPKAPPFEAQPFTVPEQKGYMLSLGLSEFTLNSASYGYYLAGLFQALINESMVSKPERIHEWMDRGQKQGRKQDMFFSLNNVCG